MGRKWARNIGHPLLFFFFFLYFLHTCNGGLWKIEALPIILYTSCQMLQNSSILKISTRFIDFEK